jgi:hypothetical protein
MISCPVLTRYGLFAIAKIRAASKENKREKIKAHARKQR